MNTIFNKTLKITLFVGLFISLMAASCKKETEEPVAYYNFTAEDYTRILDFPLYDTIIYKNQNDEEIKLVANEIVNEKARYFSPGLWGNLLYYYDKVRISLWPTDAFPGVYYSFQRHPINREGDDFYREKVPSQLSASMDFPFYNDDDGHSVVINYDTTKTEMIIGGATYRDVFTIESGINDSVLDRWGGFDYYKKVNVLYYDEFNGLIGFDDILGNNWRLNN